MRTVILAATLVLLSLGNCSGCADERPATQRPEPNYVTPGGIPVHVPEELEARDPVGLARALEDVDAYAPVWRPGWIVVLKSEVPTWEAFLADGGEGGSCDYDRRTITVAPWWLGDWARPQENVETHPTPREYWLYALDHEVGHLLFGPCHGHEDEPGCR